MSNNIKTNAMQNDPRYQNNDTNAIQNDPRYQNNKINAMKNDPRYQNNDTNAMQNDPRYQNNDIDNNNNTQNDSTNYTTENIDFQKIYTNKYDALDNTNAVKISDSTKLLWLNGDATFKVNEDGSVLISVNGVPYGWTTTDVLNQNIKTNAMQNDPRYDRIEENAMKNDPRYERIEENAMQNDPRYENNGTTNNNNTNSFEENDDQKNIGSTVLTFGASIAEGAADLAEKGVHGLAAMGAAVATPFTGLADAITGNNTTEKMWDSVGDFMLETKIKDSWDSVYNNEISDLKDKTYGFDKTRAIGNIGGEMLVGAALSAGLSAAGSAATTSTEISTTGTTAGSTASAAQNAARIESVSSATSGAASSTAGSTASAAQNAARIESASSATSGAASSATSGAASSATSGAASSATSGAASSATSGAASTITGNSGIAYSTPEEILAAVKKGDLTAKAAKKFIASQFNNIKDGGKIHSILAELSNLSKAA